MQIVLCDERTRKRGVGTGRVLPSHLSQAVAISPSRRIRPSCKSRHSGNQRHIRPVSFIERNARPVSRERLSIRFDGTSVVSMGRSIISDVSLTVERRVMNILAGPTLAGKTTIICSTACRRSFLAASNSGSRWPGLWSRKRRSCCSTSRW